MFLTPPPPTKKEPTRKIEGWFKVTGQVTVERKTKSRSPTSAKFSFVSTEGRSRGPLPAAGRGLPAKSPGSRRGLAAGPRTPAAGRPRAAKLELSESGDGRPWGRSPGESQVPRRPLYPPPVSRAAAAPRIHHLSRG